MQSPIYVGCDDSGFEAKQTVLRVLKELDLPFVDCGSGEEPARYPWYAAKVASAVSEGTAAFGILICGSGIGMSIAANKLPGVRAAAVSDVYGARLTRRHNDANILAMGARVVGEGLALMIADTFLDTPFSNDERHKRRISMIEG